MYTIKNLEQVSFTAMAETWTLAFSDYMVPMQMSPERLENYFTVSGVVKALSFGAFSEDQLVGLLINSIDQVQGERVAYDAMTGVVPEHRRKGVFTRLFQHTRESLSQVGITKYFLEVVTTNETAYNIYRKIGGTIVRELTFLSGRIDNQEYNLGHVQIAPLADFATSDEIALYQPTFSNRLVALRRSSNDYSVAYLAEGADSPAVVFSSRGAIAQIRYNSEAQREQLGAILFYISQNCQTLRVSNVPLSEELLVAELHRLGFTPVVNQYEMCIQF
ncbi:MAG: GNAT family N-acetyltransferase [Symbiobacteriaceae bacterium]|nr:GNAT family N-acetyltransferase [Symbiobacteriaceae bacterium]